MQTTSVNNLQNLVIKSETVSEKLQFSSDVV